MLRLHQFHVPLPVFEIILHLGRLRRLAPFELSHSERSPVSRLDISAQRSVPSSASSLPRSHWEREPRMPLGDRTWQPPGLVSSSSRALTNGSTALLFTILARA